MSLPVTSTFHLRLYSVSIYIFIFISLFNVSVFIFVSVMFAPVYYLMFVFIDSRVSGYDVTKM